MHARRPLCVCVGGEGGLHMGDTFPTMTRFCHECILVLLIYVPVRARRQATHPTTTTEGVRVGVGGLQASKEKYCAHCRVLFHAKPKSTF